MKSLLGFANCRNLSQSDIKKLLQLVRSPLYGWGLLLSISTTVQSQPTLAIRSADSQTVQITWASAAAGFALEETSAAGSANAWNQVNVTPVLNADRFTVSIPISAGNRFFRLRQPLFTTIQETSPV